MNVDYIIDKNKTIIAQDGFEPLTSVAFNGNNLIAINTHLNQLFRSKQQATITLVDCVNDNVTVKFNVLDNSKKLCDEQGKRTQYSYCNGYLFNTSIPRQLMMLKQLVKDMIIDNYSNDFFNDRFKYIEAYTLCNDLGLMEDVLYTLLPTSIDMAHYAQMVVAQFEQDQSREEQEDDKPTKTPYNSRKRREK